MKDEQRASGPRFGFDGELWVLTTCMLVALWGIRRLLVLVLPGEGLAGFGTSVLAAVLAGLTVSAAARAWRRGRT
ncbi:hypothetical protein SAMN05216371_8297 [Streptomyces sp. TLI_053]|nr:hypothetical protein SAMN05216371_8297 [Streptomyces sp. TLI_053]